MLVIALGIWMIRQENELSETRYREQRQQAVDLVRQQLLTRLEGIKALAAGGALAPSDPDVAQVARIESGRVLLPWIHTAAPDQDALIRRLREPSGAADLLDASPRLADEYGVPFSVYAARRLASGASLELRRKIVLRMESFLRNVWLSPAAAHMIVAVANDLNATDLRDTAADRATEAEQAEQLSRESMPLDNPGDEPVWRMFGSTPWLVSVTGRAADRERTLVAVRANSVLAAVQLPDGGRWVLSGGPDGENFSESFPGLRVSIPEGRASGRSGTRQAFYLAGLLLVISVTIFAAYLLHRDIHRETRLAALRSQFVSSVSHELKTPIASIRAFAELLDMGRVKNEQEKAEYVRAILGESERLSRQVDGVLEFSRIEQGKRIYRLQPVALEEALRSAARALDYSLAQGGFELRIDVDAAVPPVAADREAIEQAVRNLLSNAMKYSEEDKRIDLSLSLEQNNAVIRVRDRGIGIPLEEQSLIFERFHRAPDSGQRNIPGTGLGLALVDHIVKAHGGCVAVESQPGRGSTFSISLPVSVTA